MGSNLVETINAKLDDFVSASLGGQLGIDPKTTRVGVMMLAPIVLGALVKVAADARGGEQIGDLLQAGHYDGTLIDSLPKVLGGGSPEQLIATGTQLTEQLFGPNRDVLIAIVSKLSTIKPPALASLMSMVAPLVLDVIGGEVAALRLNAKGLQNLLLSQKDSLMRALPPGCGEPLGLKGMIAQAQTVPTASPSQASGLDKTIILAFVVSAIFAFGVYQYFFSGKQPGGNNQAVNPVPVEQVEEP